MASLTSPSPTGLTGLPTELLLQAASLLPKAALRSLSLVSHQLHAVARVHLFATITLTPDPSSIKAFHGLCAQNNGSVRNLVRSIHLLVAFESPHFQPISISSPPRTLPNGRLPPAYPSSLDTVFATMLSVPLVETFPNLSGLKITTLSPPSSLTAPVLDFGVPVKEVDLTGADSRHFPKWFFEALGDDVEKIVVRPRPARFVGPVNLLGRRRMLVEPIVAEVERAGEGLMRVLRRSRKTIREVDLSGARGVTLDVEPEELVLPGLETFYLTPATVVDPTFFLSTHARSLRSLTVALPLPDVPPIPFLQSLAVQGTKDSPGLTLRDAMGFLRSAKGWGYSVTDLDLSFIEFHSDILSAVLRSFPHVERLTLRGGEAVASPYGVEMVGSLASHLNHLASFRSLTSLSLLGTSLHWPRVPYDPTHERTAHAYFSAIPRLENLAWTSELSVGSRATGTERWVVLRDDSPDTGMEIRRR